MLRASSEIAVATMVASPDVNPSWLAEHPAALSRGHDVGIGRDGDSGFLHSRGASSLALLGVPVQKREPLLQIERGDHAFQVEAQTDHREGDVRVDTDDHRLGPAQLDHLRDVPEGAAGERVHDVHGGDVHDHRARPEAAHLLDEANREAGADRRR